jgi:hypothetical protein
MPQWQPSRRPKAARAERHPRRPVENDAGNVVLRLWRQAAGNLKGLIQEMQSTAKSKPLAMSPNYGGVSREPVEPPPFRR